MAPNPHDPLARFKLIQQHATPDDPPGFDAKKRYLAFDTGDRSQERLKIKSVKAETHSPGYRYLMDIMYNGNEGTQIGLIFSFFTIKITGTNLLPLVEALTDGTCIFIQEFDERKFPPPSQNDTIIDAIEVVMRNA